MKNKKTILLVLLAAVLLTGGFFSGTICQKKKSPSFPNGLKGDNPFGTGSPTTGMRNGLRGGGNSGSITAKDDKSITIKLSTGSTKTIYYSDSTTVLKQETSNLTDLTVGTNISVMGSSNSDGSETAKTIQIMPAN